MKVNKKIKIYWAPYITDKNFDWSILYYNPENLFENLKNNVDKDSFKKPGDTCKITHDIL